MGGLLLNWSKPHMHLHLGRESLSKSSSGAAFLIMACLILVEDEPLNKMMTMRVVMVKKNDSHAIMK